jgi:hypothetical protein
MLRKYEEVLEKIAQEVAEDNKKGVLNYIESQINNTSQYFVGDGTDNNKMVCKIDLSNEDNDFVCQVLKIEEIYNLIKLELDTDDYDEFKEYILNFMEESYLDLPSDLLVGQSLENYAKKGVDLDCKSTYTSCFKIYTRDYYDKIEELQDKIYTPLEELLERVDDEDGDIKDYVLKVELTEEENNLLKDIDVEDVISVYHNEPEEVNIEFDIIKDIDILKNQIIEKILNNNYTILEYLDNAIYKTLNYNTRRKNFVIENTTFLKNLTTEQLGKILENKKYSYKLFNKQGEVQTVNISWEEKEQDNIKTKIRNITMC